MICTQDLTLSYLTRIVPPDLIPRVIPVMATPSVALMAPTAPRFVLNPSQVPMATIINYASLEGQWVF
jgi:hypothetical protein